MKDISGQSIRTISTNNGLPQSFVSALVQDDSSFIWVGTRNGLARFDGIKFELFQHNSFDTVSIASNIISWIRKDANNCLWIGYETGEIDAMDPVSHKIKHYIRKDTAIPKAARIDGLWVVDNDSTFWGTHAEGLINYDRRTNQVSFFAPAGVDIRSFPFKAIGISKKDQLWLTNQHTIYTFDKKKKQFTGWAITDKQDYGVDERSAAAFTIQERYNGELIWSDGKNIFIFNPGTKAIRVMPLSIVNSRGITHIQPGPYQIDFLEIDDKVFQFSDASGIRLVGENFGGVLSFLVDRSGLIWLGTNAKGIKQIDLSVPHFKSYIYQDGFVMDIMQNIFGKNIIPQFRMEGTEGQYLNYYLRTTYDQQGNLLMAMKQSVCRYDIVLKKMIQLPPVPTRELITGISMLPDGHLLIASQYGDLFIYTSKQNWEPYTEASSLRKQVNANCMVQDIVVDDKNIWITTENDGLLKMDIASKKITQLKKESRPGDFPANQLIGIKKDLINPSILWIGSYEGLIRFDKSFGKTELFSTGHGLPDNIIYSILPDQRGNLWISTNKGICRFDPVTHQKRVFHTQHGLPNDEFNRFHHIQVPDGRMIFGGTDGWTVFDPLSMKTDEFEPTIAFTGIKINNKEITGHEKNTILPSSINAIDKIILSYEQNTISIEFAGLEYSQPHEMQYRYKLEGFDNDWVLAGNARQAYYTKLPSGNYQLLVNTTNASGKWSKYIKALNIQVKSPWWATTLAYICYAIIVAGIIWAFIRLRVSRLVMEKEVTLKEKEAIHLKELDDMKSRFFSNITHEFRTPLTLIMGPAEHLKARKDNDPQQTKLADIIIQNSKQLLTLVNRLLDLAKMEAKALKLVEQRGNPGSVVSSIATSFETEAQKKGVDILFDDHTGTLDCWFYADAVERIVYNLVSNSLKFTEIGKIDISLSAKDYELLLQVKDTGQGIPEEKIPYIFDRFYQAGDPEQLSKEEIEKSSGIGLSMVKELVKQMEGEIFVESSTEAPSGTIFTLKLPYWLATKESPESNTLNVKEIEEDDAEKTQQILLVEDSTELAEFVTSILSEKYHVTHVLNGQPGLEQALSVMPDLIISDVMMPVMDGYEFCHRLKEDIRTAHIPVILLTAKASVENRIDGLMKGANDYLTKPFHPTELLLRVQNQLTSQQKLREHLQHELSLPVNIVTGAEPEITDIFLIKLYAHLDEYLDDSNFGVDQLAALLNMSRSSLHRKLKSITGLSTTDVVRRYRLKKGIGFLLEGYSSADTAYKSGFGSPAYFTKCFREVYTLTPGEFVKSYKATHK